MKNYEYIDARLNTLLLSARFPFFAADVLASNAMILQAMLEGGWSQDKDEEPTSATETSSTTAGTANDSSSKDGRSADSALFEQ